MPTTPTRIGRDVIVTRLGAGGKGQRLLAARRLPEAAWMYFRQL